MIGDNGQVVLDKNGIPTYQPTVDPVQDLRAAARHHAGRRFWIGVVTVPRRPRNSAALEPHADRQRGCATPASMAIDPTTGNLWIADNGIDGNDGGNEAWSADRLDRIPAAKIGGRIVEYFGFFQPWSMVDLSIVMSKPSTSRVIR